MRCFCVLKYDISIKSWNKINIALFWFVLQYVLCSCTSGIDGFYNFLYLSSSINLINYIWVFIWLLKWNLDVFWKPQILHSKPLKIGGESSEQGALIKILLKILIFKFFQKKNKDNTFMTWSSWKRMGYFFTFFRKRCVSTFHFLYF